MVFNKSFMRYMHSFCKKASYVKKVANTILRRKGFDLLQVNYFSHCTAALHGHCQAPKK